MEVRRGALGRSSWWIAVLAAGMGGACGEPARPPGEPAQPPSEPPLVGDPRDVLVVTQGRELLERHVRTHGGIELPDDVEDAAHVGRQGEILVVVGGPRSHLAIARDATRVAGARVLDATAIESTLRLEWQWEVDPDGRSICVHRAASRMVHWAHGAPREAVPEIARVAWIAIVPFDGSAATTLEVDGIDGAPGHDAEILGWSEGRCVVGLHRFPEDRTLAFHPERPRDPDVLVSGRQRVRQLSPRGSMAVGFSGFEGEAISTLYRLGAGARGATRELLRDGETRYVAGYAWIGQADVTYAPDDAWVAVRRTEWRAPRFEVTLRMESPDGSRVLYADAWRTSDATERSDPPERAIFDPPSAAPSGQRVQYVRVGAGGTLERVVVDLADGARARVLGSATPLPLGGPLLAPLWSPDGDQLVVVDDAWRVTRYDVRTGAATDLGELPRDAIAWRW